MKLILDHKITVEELCHEIWVSNTHDDCFEIIKKLDEYIEDWDFTKKCYEYFKNIMIDCPKKVSD